MDVETQARRRTSEYSGGWRWNSTATVGIFESHYMESVLSKRKCLIDSKAPQRDLYIFVPVLWFDLHEGLDSSTSEVKGSVSIDGGMPPTLMSLLFKLRRG